MSERRRPPAALLFLVIVINVFTVDSLTCHPAEYEVNNKCCLMCPAGSRVKIDCMEYRSTSCLPCKEGTFTEKPNGLKRCSSCTICDSGSRVKIDCTEYRSTSCLPCEEGTFTDKPSSKTRCSSCATCDSGSGLTVKKRCTVTSDTVCEPLEGFLCIYSTKENGCAATKKHRSCEPGQYIHQKGTAFTDTVCSTCSDGTFSNGRTTTCQQHTQCKDLNLPEITARTPSADAQCGIKSLSVTIIAVSLSLLVLLATGLIGGIVWFRKRMTIFQLRQTNSRSSENGSQDKRQNGSNREEALRDIRGNSKTNLKTENVKSICPPATELNFLNETSD